VGRSEHDHAKDASFLWSARARRRENALISSVERVRIGAVRPHETELACSIMSVLLSCEKGEIKDVFTRISETF
jgi:hypothetical protein